MNNNYGIDLDFKAIWDILVNGLEILKKDNSEWNEIIATLFYGMAFMNDHVLVYKTNQTDYWDLSYDAFGKELI